MMHYHGRIERLELKVKELEAQATPEWELLTRAAQQAWARIEAALAFCEQQAKDRSPWSDDREQYSLDYVDGWNDALDRVETLLRGESGE